MSPYLLAGIMGILSGGMNNYSENARRKAAQQAQGPRMGSTGSLYEGGSPEGDVGPANAGISKISPPRPPIGPADLMPKRTPPPPPRHGMYAPPPGPTGTLPNQPPELTPMPPEENFSPSPDLVAPPTMDAFNFTKMPKPSATIKLWDKNPLLNPSVMGQDHWFFMGPRLKEKGLLNKDFMPKMPIREIQERNERIEDILSRIEELRNR